MGSEMCIRDRDKGMDLIAPFFVTPFTGILCLFLLDMGLSAGRSLLRNRHLLSMGLFAFGILMPVIGALLGGATGASAGVILGDVLDDRVLNNYRCLDCGYSFSVDPDSPDDTR